MLPWHHRRYFNTNLDNKPAEIFHQLSMNRYEVVREAQLDKTNRPGFWLSYNDDRLPEAMAPQAHLPTLTELKT